MSQPTNAPDGELTVAPPAPPIAVGAPTFAPTAPSEGESKTTSANTTPSKKNYGLQDPKKKEKKKKTNNKLEETMAKFFDDEIYETLIIDFTVSKTLPKLVEQHTNLMATAYMKMNHQLSKSDSFLIEAGVITGRPRSLPNIEENTVIVKMDSFFPLQEERKMALALEMKMQELNRLSVKLIRTELIRSGKDEEPFKKAWNKSSELPEDEMKATPFGQFEKNKARLREVFYSYLKLRKAFAAKFEKKDKSPFDMWLTRLAEEELFTRQNVGNNKEIKTCYFCLSPMKAGLKELSCQHKVHLDCWQGFKDLTGKVQCGLCREDHETPPSSQEVQLDEPEEKVENEQIEEKVENSAEVEETNTVISLFGPSVRESIRAFYYSQRDRHGHTMSMRLVHEALSLHLDHPQRTMTLSISAEYGLDEQQKAILSTLGAAYRGRVNQVMSQEDVQQHLSEDELTRDSFGHYLVQIENNFMSNLELETGDHYQSLTAVGVDISPLFIENVRQVINTEGFKMLNERFPEVAGVVEVEEVAQVDEVDDGFVFDCNHCGRGIIRDSRDHDACVSNDDGELWWCEDCAEFAEVPMYRGEFFERHGRKFRPQTRMGECQGCKGVCEECENLIICE